MTERIVRVLVNVRHDCSFSKNAVATKKKGAMAGMKQHGTEIAKRIPISILITTFNDEESVTKLLTNIEGQDCCPAEIVVCDGGSQDLTLSKVKGFSRSSELNIRIVGDGNRLNIAQGLNECIKQSSEEWVVILGTGNVYETDFLKLLWRAKTTSNALVFYSSVLGINSNHFSSVFNKYFLNGNKRFDWEPSNRGVLIKNDVFSECGLFWENFVYAGEDSEFFDRLRNLNVVFEYVPEALLHWQTPTSWHEFKKKMEVNAIADLQIKPRRVIFWRIFSILLLVAVTALSIYWLPAMTLSIVVVAALAVFRKKNTWNFASIALGLISKLMMVSFYISYRGFSRPAWHVSTQEAATLHGCKKMDAS